jgi:hypothetical protein
MGGGGSSSVTNTTQNITNASTRIGDIGLTGSSAVQLANVIATSGNLQVERAYQSLDNLVERFSETRVGGAQLNLGSRIDPGSAIVVVGVAVTLLLLSRK